MQSPGEKLAAQLRRLKKENQWSAADMAKIVGDVSEGTIRNALGAKAANPYNLKRIAEAFGLDPLTFDPMPMAGLPLPADVMQKLTQWAAPLGWTPGDWISQLFDAMGELQPFENFVREMVERREAMAHALARGVKAVGVRGPDAPEDERQEPQAFPTALQRN